ncbi:ATP-binding cassette domain-containing protein [Micromonospora sp. NPDC000207]|uniref:ABC transporter ATP-binding protein n=1 Tax=Micromonospora sp. NPDC000207 TaxID=3154246 RepID=UPI00331AFCF5
MTGAVEGPVTEAVDGPGGAVAARVVGLRADVGGRRLLDGVSFDLPAGRILAVVGASGSGKTTLGRALLGEAGPGVRLTGTVQVAGRTVTTAEPPPPGSVGYVPQQPAAVLNPVRRIGPVLHEIARRHPPVDDDSCGKDDGGEDDGRGRGWIVGRWGVRRGPARAAVRGVLERVSLPADRGLLRRFPHQLSGGQQQRLVIAHALLAGARLLVADEPTTGQDNLTRQDVAAELAALASREGLAVVLLSHDLHLVRAVADDLLVLHRGVPVESGPTGKVFAVPRHPWTRRLVATTGPTDAPGHLRTAAETRQRETRQREERPREERPREDADREDAHREERAGGRRLLDVRGLVAGHGPNTVLRVVDVQVAAGECLALVGRSGSGKTTLARCVAGLHRPRAGTVALGGRPLAATVDDRSLTDLASVQYVFQDARAGFDPWRTVLDQVARPAVRLHGHPVDVARAAARAALDRVGLAGNLVTRNPGRLSGGELHRAALARALLAGPRLLVCDEITAGLDGVTRDRILDLVDEVRHADGLALLVISHDRDVVARLADRVAVLHDCHIVEEGPAATLLTSARHWLTRSLLPDDVTPDRTPQDAVAPGPPGDAVTPDRTGKPIAQERVSSDDQ